LTETVTNDATASRPRPHRFLHCDWLQPRRKMSMFISLKRCSQLWLWCNCDTTVMRLRHNLSVTQWRRNFVIFLFTDIDFIRYSSSITYEIDVIEYKKIMTANNRLPLLINTTALPFFVFRIHYRDSPDCYFWAYLFPTFSFSVFTLFSCRFRAVDSAHSCWLSSAR